MASVDLLQGTLDLLLLKALSWGPMHGYEVNRWIRTTTGEALSVEEGALYPALHRLEARGWIEFRCTASFSAVSATPFASPSNELASRAVAHWITSSVNG